MARPKDEDKRTAIMAAAARVIVSRGLGAPTAVIAREAGVSNGSLFTYFDTKAELFNQLYLELKVGMATAALEGLPAEAKPREKLFHVWSNWTAWAVAYPDGRRALEQLIVSDEITPATRVAGHAAMAGVGELLELVRTKGPLRDAPVAFVVAIMNALADTTMDFMTREPADAGRHSRAGFDALWRVLG